MGFHFREGSCLGGWGAVVVVGQLYLNTNPRMIRLEKWSPDDEVAVGASLDVMDVKEGGVGAGV